MFHKHKERQGTHQPYVQTDTDVIAGPYGFNLLSSAVVCDPDWYLNFETLSVIVPP